MDMYNYLSSLLNMQKIIHEIMLISKRNKLYILYGSSLSQEFISCRTTPAPIKDNPDNDFKVKILPFSRQTYFPAMYVMKNLRPLVTGTIVVIPAFVDAKVQMNVTLQ